MILGQMRLGMSLSQAGTILGWSDTVAALELFAQVRGREAHLTGYVGNGQFRVIRKQDISLFHTDGIDELREGHAVGIGRQQIVQTMTTDAEALHDVCAHQVYVSIKPILANSSANLLEQVLTHVDFFVIGCKGKENKK